MSSATFSGGTEEGSLHGNAGNPFKLEIVSEEMVFIAVADIDLYS